MMGITPIPISKSFGSSPMPNHTISNGINASGGKGRPSSISGSMISRSGRTAAMAAPSITPAIAPQANPARMRIKLAAVFPSSVSPRAG